MTSSQQLMTSNQQPINSNQSPITVLIADDHPIVRQGLSFTLSMQPDITVVAEAGTGKEALDLAHRHKPDVIVLDLEMPQLNGLAILAPLSALQPAPQILILTSYATEENIKSALQADVSGFHIKDSEPQKLVEAIRAVYHGGHAFHPTILDRMMRYLYQPNEPSGIVSLTQSEMDVFRLLGDGLTNPQIAKQLNLTTRTVSTRVRNILDKLDIENRNHAVIYAHNHFHQTTTILRKP
ncbi:MAG: response regulator transcription factor [Chloroflexota bacterium]